MVYSTGQVLEKPDLPLPTLSLTLSQLRSQCCKFGLELLVCFLDKIKVIIIDLIRS